MFARAAFFSSRKIVLTTGSSLSLITLAVTCIAATTLVRFKSMPPRNLFSMLASRLNALGMDYCKARTMMLICGAKRAINRLNWLVKIYPSALMLNDSSARP